MGRILQATWLYAGNIDNTYLVPDTLKSAYGHPPAVALFATQARYKREAFRGSKFVPRIFADNGLQVVMKSYHPVLNSWYLVYEAQQAHYYGLPHNLALAAVTSTPAKVGWVRTTASDMSKRVRYDADIVLWDSHPLALGATPQQVWIDGVAQINALSELAQWMMNFRPGRLGADYDE
ncbi:hypothetical protein C8Q76DRAFT_858520 [Earliella scabrosa]|nr:hypothetical protein C8Q76DRAFT_858520 [Earliella scabrosa]